jgi:signal transduction histidine kinase
VAAADETRRRIERDLHDGTQQRLVSLALAVRAAEAKVPPGLDDLRAELEARVADHYRRALTALDAAGPKPPARGYLAAICQLLVSRKA